MSNLVSVFDSLFSDFFPAVRRTPWIMQQSCHVDAPQLHTADDAYTFDLDVPGVDKDDLVTELNKDILTIYTKSDEEDESREQKRAYRFQFKVPEDIDALRLSARLKNGVLTITLPKSEEKKPIKVPVMIE